MEQEASNILVAEDDPQMRTLVSDSLRRTGYRVTTAADGASALSYVRACEQLEDSAMPSAIVADIRMPNVNGLQLLSSLGDQGTPVPVILITAFGDPELHAEARRLGAVAMFDKPFDLDELRSTVASVVPPPPPQRSTSSLEEVACVAHDLRTPLALVDIGLDLICEVARGSALAERLGREVDRIQRNTRYMERLVSDLVELPRVDAGQLHLQRRRISLVRVVSETLDLALSRRDRERTAVTVATDCFVDADEHRIKRVVANLVQNAAKYAPWGTPIGVAIAELGRRARVSVTDTGLGLSSDEARHVFDRYRRARSSTGTHGSGLGLYISKRIVEAHGGTIGLERLPIGTKFFFELPVATG